MIYTYRPFFLLTLLHPSHSFLTELLTFMPRECCAACNRRPLKRAVRSSSGCARGWRRLGRRRVLQAHVGVWMWRCRKKVREDEKSVRPRGKRRDRGSILADLPGVTNVVSVVVVVMVVKFEEISAKKSTCPPRSTSTGSMARFICVSLRSTCDCCKGRSLHRTSGIDRRWDYREGLSQGYKMHTTRFLAHLVDLASLFGRPRINFLDLCSDCMHGQIRTCKYHRIAGQVRAIGQNVRNASRKRYQVCEVPACSNARLVPVSPILRPTS